jgi:hypothetical protein
MGTCGDQDVDGRRAALMGAAGEVALYRNGGVLDLSVDREAGQLEEIGEEFVVVSRAAGRPAGLEQKRGTDGRRSRLFR